MQQNDILNEVSIINDNLEVSLPKECQLGRVK
jgi:hypothetical protein